MMAKRNPAGDVVLRRKMRRYQANHRGSKLSYLERYENAVVCLAWEAEVLSEGQAARALGVGRIELRDMRNEAITAGEKIGEALWCASRAKKR